MQRGIVWVVDDDSSIRWVLERALAGAGLTCTTFENGAEAENAIQALDMLQQYRPDILITDIRMPGMDGLALLKQIKQRHPMLPVIIMTAHSDLDAAVSAYQQGAFDYLPKPFEPKELVLRIKNILRRAPQEDGQAVEKLNLGLCCYDMVKKELLTKQGTVIHITPVEQAMLNVLGQKSGQIFTREKLAEILGAGQSPRSIDVQITRLRKKIEKDSKNPRYLQTVRGKGYMLLPE